MGKPRRKSAEFYQNFRKDLIQFFLTSINHRVREQSSICSIEPVFLITKPVKHMTMGKKLQSSLLMNRDTKILSKIIENQNQELIMKIVFNDQVTFIPGRQSCFNIPNSINAINHIIKLKGEYYIIISVNTEKALDKILHVFMIKSQRCLE